VRANWKRPGLAVGGFFLAAGLIGTLAGMSVRDDAGSAQADPAATIGRAPAKQQTDVAASSSTHFVPAVETPAGAGSHARTRHSASRHRPSAWAKQEIASVEAGGTPAGQGQATQLAGDQLAADPLAPEPAAAKMALPDKVVARTLDRVGYRCGEVASTAAVQGSSGAFKVTCTSGQSYQATKVHGRYRFSRSH